MHFLNDKFFRFAVFVFLLFMALPFMFATPQEKPDTLAKTLSEGNSSPFYQFIDRIANFYGFKKENNKINFTLNSIQTDNLNKNNNKEQNPPLSQEASFITHTQNKTETNLSAIPQTQNKNQKQTSVLAQSSLTYNQYKNTNTYEDNKAGNYQPLTNKISSKYIAYNRQKKDSPLYKAERQKNQKTTIVQNKTEYENQNTDKKNLNKNNTQDIKQENKTIVSLSKEINSFDKTKTSKGSLGQDYLNPKSKSTEDALQAFDTGFKELRALKLNENKEDTKESGGESANRFTRTYKAEVFNAKDGKKEIISYQKTITTKDVKKAEDIKQITLASIDEKEKTTYKDNLDQEQPFPSYQETNFLRQLPNFIPHNILALNNQKNLLNQDSLKKQFLSSRELALKILPKQKEDYPTLEFVYRKQDDQVLRAPNDSFNVMIISKILADRVALPPNKNIDFLKPQESIYVVDEESLYQQYKNNEIPVIYYPQLSPANLQQAYETAYEAIQTLDHNKKANTKQEQNKNKQEIERALTQKLDKK